MREQGDWYLEADTLTRLGDAYEKASDFQHAEESWRCALKIYEDLGHPQVDQVRTKLDAVT